MNNSSMRRCAVMIAAGMCVLLAACSAAKKDESYKHARVLQPLEVPPDLINPEKDKSTAIPALPIAKPAPVQDAGKESAPPPAAGEQANIKESAAPSAVRIERDGAQRWLVVARPLETVRLQVKDFLLQQGFTVLEGRAAANQLETDWHGGALEAGSSAGELDSALKNALQDKVKARIEAGRAAGTVEITLAHQGLQRVMVDKQAQWQPRPADPLFEAALLDQLKAYLEGESVAAPQSDLPKVRMDITTDAQEMSTLRINEGFERAWRRVGIALGRGGFVVEDRNRSEGLYLIRLGTAFKEDANAGFVARLFGSNAGDPDKQYRIHLEEKGGDATTVIVQHPGGAPVHTGIGERILDRLKSKME